MKPIVGSRSLVGFVPAHQPTSSNACYGHVSSLRPCRESAALLQTSVVCHTTIHQTEVHQCRQRRTTRRQLTRTHPSRSRPRSRSCPAREGAQRRTSPDHHQHDRLRAAPCARLRRGSGGRRHASVRPGAALRRRLLLRRRSRRHGRLPPTVHAPRLPGPAPVEDRAGCRRLDGTRGLHHRLGGRAPTPPPVHRQAR